MYLKHYLHIFSTCRIANFVALEFRGIPSFISVVCSFVIDANLSVGFRGDFIISMHTLLMKSFQWCQRPYGIGCYFCTRFLAHLSRRLKWAIVIAHRPSSVRPSSSSVRRKIFTFPTSSPEPLDGFWWNLVGMKYSWSLTSVVVFRPDPPRGGSRAGPK